MGFDAIVIGSGFGGSVAALRFAEAGLRVLVLERGRRWSKSSLPRQPGDAWVWDHRNPERSNGWLDLRLFAHMAVAQGAAVGGGSHIYANISTEAPPISFERGWPAEITYGDLKSHYTTVGDMMEVQAVPDGQWTQRMKLMKDGAVATGHGDRFRQLELAVQFDSDWTYEKDFAKGEEGSKPYTNRHGATQGTCVHLGTCDIGCTVGARNTLDLNYLYSAENKFGAEIRPLHLVDRIEQVDGHWRVHFDDISTGARRPGFEDAGIVLVAAGSLGSTELLLRNRDVHGTLPALSRQTGKNWSCNGDFLTPALYEQRDVDANVGPTIASAIDFQDGSVENQQFWIQDGGIPDVVLSYLSEKSNDPATSYRTKLLIEKLQVFLRRSDPLRQVMPWFAQGVDAGNGTLALSGPSYFSTGGDISLNWDIKESAPLIDAIVDMHKQLSISTAGTPIVPPSWSLFRYLVTPHPLGGCNMASDTNAGVVDHTGAVFGYPNLFVLDGAIIPRPLGVNPSRTIAAIAERNVQLILRNQGRVGA